jgi:hypothetical protein
MNLEVLMKTVKEVSVRLENRPGTLLEISELLAANGINILALTVRTEGQTGTLSFVATDPARVINILESAGYQAVTQEIVAAEAPNHPGGLHAMLKPLKLAGINIEYLYSFLGSSGSADHAILFLRVNDPAAARDVLSREWIRLHGEEIYNY